MPPAPHSLRPPMRRPRRSPYARPRPRRAMAQAAEWLAARQRCHYGWVDSRVPDMKFEREDGETLAYLARGGKSPGMIWLGGFKSDMTGTKAAALDDWAARAGRAFLRFDYFGHGQ